MRVPLLLLVLGSLGCGPAPERLDVVVLLADTLRADHLGAYGYGRDTSPALDRLAGEGALFLQARSQAACTYPSVNSLLTSRRPGTFLGQADDAMGIPEGVESLAEILARAGYRTGAVSASSVVRATPTPHNPIGGFDRGFERFDESCLAGSAACVNRAALEWLDGLGDDEPFFLYLHYFDPHAPYRPPEDHVRRFAGPPPADAPRFVGLGDPFPIARRLYDLGQSVHVPDTHRAHFVDLYDEEIAFLDGEVGHLLRALEARGRAGSTALFFLADHGESFLEHDHLVHCRTVYEEVVRTPLIARVPGLGPVVVEAPVENLDLVPTILDLAGVEIEPDRFEGRSLRPELEGWSGEPRVAVAEQSGLAAVTDGRLKLIVDWAAESFSLFDLESDPGETVDLGPSRAADARRLQGELRALIEPTVESLDAAEAAERHLRSLGYLP